MGTEADVSRGHPQSSWDAVHLAELGPSWTGSDSGKSLSGFSGRAWTGLAQDC
jgi:hypothetical protein